jgi:hypothetical protein
MGHRGWPSGNVALRANVRAPGSDAFANHVGEGALVVQTLPTGPERDARFGSIYLSAWPWPMAAICAFETFEAAKRLILEGTHT